MALVPSGFSLAGGFRTGVAAFWTGRAPEAVFAGVLATELLAVLVVLDTGVAAFLTAGLFGVEDGSGFFVPIGVRLAVFDASPTGVLLAATGTFFAESTVEDFVFEGMVFDEAAGRGFWVPIGVRAGPGFAGVDVFGVLIFAGVFLIGVDAVGLA